MTIYNCTPCVYKTDRKCNYDKHLTTKVHGIKVAAYITLPLPKNTTDHTTDQKNDPVVAGVDELQCNACGLVFTHETNMYRHKRLYCKTAEKDKEIAKLKEELQQMKDRELIELRKEVKTLNQRLDTVNTINDKSLSALNYVIKNYTDTPAIEDIPKLTIETFGDIPKFILMLLHKYRNNIAHKFIGDYILKHYKRDNPADQSIHSSDAVRNNLLGKYKINDKAEWTKDIRGVKFCEDVVRPLLIIIKVELQNYLNMNRRKEIDILEEDMNTHLDKLKYAANIVKDIDNTVLEREIIRYLTPKLYLKKSGIHSDSDEDEVELLQLKK
jgi:hypothetical protein